MADAPAAAKPVSKPLLFVLLVVCAVGTVWFSAMTWERLFAEEADRKGGLAYLFTALAWFLFWSWVIRAIARPFPAQG